MNTLDEHLRTAFKDVFGLEPDPQKGFTPQ
jgi:hypothetical protein